MYGLFHYQVEIDKKATKEWYAAAAEWNCSCESCRNFVSLARKRKFPEFHFDLEFNITLPFLEVNR